VTDARGRARYELHLDGRLVGFCEYAPRPGRLEFRHVEVDPELRGRGLATRLVRAALSDVRMRGGLVEPTCPFVRHVLGRNPEFSEVIFSAPVDPLTKGLKRT